MVVGQRSESNEGNISLQLSGPEYLTDFSCGAGTCGDWPILSRQSKAIYFPNYSLGRGLAAVEVKGSFYFFFPPSGQLCIFKGSSRWRSSMPIIFFVGNRGASRSQHVSLSWEAFFFLIKHFKWHILRSLNHPRTIIY